MNCKCVAGVVVPQCGLAPRSPQVQCSLLQSGVPLPEGPAFRLFEWCENVPLMK